jgi:hypothetical protein
MRVIEVIPARRWRNVVNGRAVSIYGCVPWTSDAEKADWTLETSGWTWRNDNGTVGLSRPPAKTREEAEQIMRTFNNLGVESGDGVKKSMKKRLTPQESAKRLRSRLKKSFPGVKFSVRLSRGTAYGNVSVRWSEGPPFYEDVAKVALPYEGKSFDAMTDSTSHHERPIGTEDGTVLLSGLGYVLLHGPWRAAGVQP